MATNDKYSELEKLSQLLEKGILTKEEFEIEKSKILNRADNVSQNQNSVEKDNPLIDLKIKLPKSNKTNKTKWYNKAGWLWLSILFWPLLVYGLYKTEIMSKKTKKIILISFLSLGLLGGILNIIFYKDPYKMKQFLNDGKMTIQYQDDDITRTIYLEFKNQEIVYSSCKPGPFIKTPAGDWRLLYVMKYTYNSLKLQSPVTISDEGNYWEGLNILIFNNDSLSSGTYKCCLTPYESSKSNGFSESGKNVYGTVTIENYSDNSKKNDKNDITLYIYSGDYFKDDDSVFFRVIENKIYGLNLKHIGYTEDNDTINFIDTIVFNDVKVDADGSFTFLENNKQVSGTFVQGENNNISIVFNNGNFYLKTEYVRDTKQNEDLINYFKLNSTKLKSNFIPQNGSHIMPFNANTK